jgi:hypothetical protein
MDIKAKRFAINEMKRIFLMHIDVLHNKSPKDAMFREQIFGVPFWAEGQRYGLCPLMNDTGVLLDYRIRRGLVGQAQMKTRDR